MNLCLLLIGFLSLQSTLSLSTAELNANPTTKHKQIHGLLCNSFPINEAQKGLLQVCA